MTSTRSQRRKAQKLSCRKVAKRASLVAANVMHTTPANLSDIPASKLARGYRQAAGLATASRTPWGDRTSRIGQNMPRPARPERGPVSGPKGKPAKGGPAGSDCEN